MINYTEKGHGLHLEVGKQGHSLWQEGADWKSTDDIAVQTIIDGYDDLPDWKVLKIEEIRNEGLSRLGVDFPFLVNWETVEFMVEFWQSLSAAAKQPTAKFQQLIDIFAAGKDGAVAVNALATVATVNAFDAQTDVAWP